MKIVQWMRAARSPGLIFAAAFLVRVCFFVTILRGVPLERVWNTGFEVSRIAESLADGRGFGSPFGVPTGPTAWVPPVYPAILAAVFKIFGTYTALAAWSMLLLNALFAACTALAIFLTGERTLGRGVGTVSGWIWVLMPYSVVMSIKVWETSLSALLVVAAVLLYERMKFSRSLLDWAYWGLFWGFAALVNPALGIFFPVLSFGAGWRDRTHSAPRVAVAVAAFCIVLAPWIARNHFRLNSFVPIRSNFGEELWLGNHEGVLGPNDETRHPLGDLTELDSYRKLGERDYVAEKRRDAEAFIVAHPGQFISLTFRRVVYFWTLPRGSIWPYISACSFVGLAFAVMMKGFLQALPFATGLLLFPGVYYLTHADNWYRHPIEPIMILLAVWAIGSTWRYIAARRLRTYLRSC